MAKRGRKSAAELAVAVAAPAARAERLPAPCHLSDFEAAVWRRVVDAMPADWFDDSSAELLTAYCKHVGIARLVDEELTQFDPEWLKLDDGLDRFKKLTDVREKHSRVLTTLATKMRLTHQARILPQTAGTKVANAPKGSRPWELA